MAFLFDHWGIAKRGQLPRENGPVYRKVLLRKTPAGYVGRAGNRWAFNWGTKYFQWREDPKRLWELILVQQCRGFTHAAMEVDPADTTRPGRLIRVHMNGHGFDLRDELNRCWTVRSLASRPVRWCEDAWPKRFKVLERLTELEDDRWFTEDEAKAILEIWTGENE